LYSAHVFRLSEGQRKIYTCEKLREYLLGREPKLVGIQNNGCWAVFYEHENQRFLRVILDLKVNKVTIVTFYIIENTQLPIIR